MRRLALIPAFLLLNACATDLVVGVPYAQIESPEASGVERGFSFGVGVTPTKKIQVVADAQSRPPEYQTLEKHAYADPQAKVMFGLLKRIDLGLQQVIVSNTTFATAKIQLFGDGALSGKEGLLLAIYGRYGKGADKESGDQMTTFGNGGYPWSAKAGVTVSEGGVSLGYRFKSDLVFFIGAAENKYDGYANVDHERSATGDKPEAHYSQKYDGKSRSAGVGFSLGKQSRFSFHAVGTEFEWTGVRKIEDLQGGVDYLVSFE